jgi:hypothetical protein
MTAVNLLEANWISIQEIFELVSRVLTWMFIGLWPKKKAEVPKDDLKKLARAFDTTDDPILQLKGLSLKRGALSSWPHPLRVKSFLQEGEEVGTSPGINYFPFGGFRDFYCANSSDGRARASFNCWR